MKYIPLIGAAIMAISGSAFAADSIDEAMTALKSNERLVNFEVIHDKTMTALVRNKINFPDEIIQVAGSRMGLDIKSGLVYQLSGAYTVGDLISVQEVITDLVLNDTANLDFYPISMPEGTVVNATMYIFTDPTCGYCRKMHTEKAEYDALGVQKVVIPWPRQGLSDESTGFQQWVKVACSVNPGDAYHEFIEKGTVPVADPSKTIDECKAVVTKGYMLGRQLGISGTPFIYVKHKDGQTLKRPGYVPVSDIMRSLNAKSAPTI
jgi:protein-disulfide isomerase